MKRSIFVLAVIALLVTGGSAFGGQLLKNRVGASANWVAHLNLEHFAKSQLGRLIRAELNKQGLEEQLQGFKTVFSFHPIDDIRNVTIYGTGDERQKAVALFEGTFDPDKLVALVRMNPRYKEIKHGDAVVHSWVDENKEEPNAPRERTYGYIYKGNTVVMGSGLEALKQAVDVLKGAAPNAAGGTFQQEALNAKGAFFQVAANALSDLAEHKNEAALLEKTDKFGGAIGENDGKFYVDITLRAESEEVALNVQKMVEGIVALLNLADAEPPQLAEMAKKIKFSTVGRIVKINFESDSESFFAFLKEKWEAEKRKKERATAQ
ncbi:MAG: hypothetical protein ACYS8Z_00675 [Planctomycetota bacterium]|jgi:hypothetical protein